MIRSTGEISVFEMSGRKVGTLVRLFFTCLSCLLLTTPVGASPNCTTVKAAIKISSEIRGLSVRKSVPCYLKSKREVRRYLRDSIERKIPEKRLLGEERTFKLLGFIPEDFDYRAGLISLYTEQVSGYYDAEEEYYAMADWMPEVMQLPIAVHELDHALQDQHFDLDDFIDFEGSTTDEQLARSALVEGDAMAVMIDYSRSLVGLPSLSEEESVSTFMAQNLVGVMFSSSLRKVPQALQSMMLFPYMSGLNFVHGLLKRGGYREVDLAFENSPRSTEDILHPSRRRRGKKGFHEIKSSDPIFANDFDVGQIYFSDRLGEFLVSVLLNTWLPPAESTRAADGWGGDRVVLQGSPSGGEKLFWFVRWDSRSDKREFFDALVKAYGRRFEMEVKRPRDSVVFDDTEFGRVEIENRAKGVVLKILSGN